MSGIAPIVKDLPNVMSRMIPPEPNASSPSTPGLGLHSVPTPAEISRVTVVATTSTSEGSHEPPPAPSSGCGTSTVSAISFPDVIDLSVGDNNDPADIIVDDQPSAASAVARPLTKPFKPRQASSSSSVPPPVWLNERQPRNSLSLPPIATTATAISNHSADLRSFAPWSIACAITPHVPFAAVHSPDPALGSVTLAYVRPPRQPNASMSVLGGEHSTQEPAPLVQDVVRSLPMGVFLPENGVESGCTPSFSFRRGRSWENRIAPTGDSSPRRDRTTSRSRSRSRGPVPGSRSSSTGIQVAPVSSHG